MIFYCLAKRVRNSRYGSCSLNSAESAVTTHGPDGNLVIKVTNGVHAEQDGESGNRGDRFDPAHIDGGRGAVVVQAGDQRASAGRHNRTNAAGLRLQQAAP